MVLGVFARRGHCQLKCTLCSAIGGGDIEARRLTEQITLPTIGRMSARAYRAPRAITPSGAAHEIAGVGAFVAAGEWSDVARSFRREHDGMEPGAGAAEACHRGSIVNSPPLIGLDLGKLRRQLWFHDRRLY